MSLFTELVKIKGRKGHDEFWDSKDGNFSQLNQINNKNLNATILRNIQIGILKKQLIINGRMNAANDFINNILPTYNQNQSETIIANEGFQTIVSLLNSPFVSSGRKEIREQSDKIAQLENALKQVNINLPIPPTVKTVLEKTSAITKEDKSFYKYRAEKADFYEKIVTAFITGSNLGEAITTGSWGNINKNNQQLVTDVYIFLHDSANSAKISGSYSAYQKTGSYKEDISAAKNGNFVTVQDQELTQFIEMMNEFNGHSEIGVSIDDEMANCLDTVSSLKVSVKSGTNQSILNTNNINAIELSSLGSLDKLQLLMKLYNIDAAQGFRFLYKNPKKDSSPTLTAYANYLLSINIDKTTLCKDNDIYFTNKGFETVVDWMINRPDKYLKFVKDIKLTASLLTEKRKYNFYSI